MKFVVHKGYGGEVDVKLHWESKDKIKKIFLWTTYAAGTVAYIAHSRKKNALEASPRD